MQKRPISYFKSSFPQVGFFFFYQSKSNCSFSLGNVSDLGDWLVKRCRQPEHTESCLHHVYIMPAFTENSDCCKSLCVCPASLHWVCTGSWLWVLGPLGGETLWKGVTSLCGCVFAGVIEILASSSLYFCFMSAVRGGSLLHRGLPTMMTFLTTSCLKAMGTVAMDANLWNQEQKAD